MDTSIFMDKSIMPSDTDLKSALGKTYSIWGLISEFVYSQYFNSVSEWKYPGAKYGWSFRIKDRKRVIIYLLPRKGFFKAAFMFGQKATDEIIKSDVSREIKEELQNARVYAEGRGIRIDVKSKEAIKDIKELINIKLSN
ncbi:MAG: DUF3788 domain-containing protein [Ignavibacteria bacterium]